MEAESTVICLDNSDYMRNGDFMPTRLQNQQDAVQFITQGKLRRNPESTVALITVSKIEVLATLCSDHGRLHSKLTSVLPAAPCIQFVTGLRIAHLVLKHRQGRNSKTRIIVFVGSPIIEEESELVKLAKKFKKEKVSVDVVNFGEETVNTTKLTTFVNTLNGVTAPGSSQTPSSHLCTVSATGTQLTDAIVVSPIVGGGGDGAMAAGGAIPGFANGMLDSDDPEILLALRVSLEEQRARQDEEMRRNAGGALPATTAENVPIGAAPVDVEPGISGGSSDLSAMTEEEQIQYAIQMSMLGGADAAMDTSAVGNVPPVGDSAPAESAPAATGDGGSGGAGLPSDIDVSDAISDVSFLQGVLSSLPGVDNPSQVLEQVRQQNPNPIPNTQASGQQQPKPPAEQSNKQPPPDKDKPK